MNPVAAAIPNPDDFTLRLRRVTEELRGIERDISQMAASKPLGSGPLDKEEHLQLVSLLLDMTLLAELKVVVDHLRQILRTYMDDLAERGGDNKEYARQVCRIQDATEALRLLHDQAQGLAQGELAKRSSFIDRIDSLVEYRLQHPKDPSHTPEAALVTR
ncbi:MAG TPA: hypothetical protein VK699_18375 [Terriglobales bacterium]|jgi:hypothetical protein|nr:hypothetical protein [Terriglobales bacterium]